MRLDIHSKVSLLVFINRSPKDPFVRIPAADDILDSAGHYWCDENSFNIMLWTNAERQCR